MMGRTDGQLNFICIDLKSLIPANHLLKQIDRIINFEFIYKLAEPYYADKGRPSVDPVCMVKMLLVGYLYGIRSERRLEEEVNLNIAYRWFCGFSLEEKIPDHSVFSQNRRRRFQDNDLFLNIFNSLIIQCIERGIITGTTVVSDGSFIPANVASSSTIEVTRQITKSTVKYLDLLDEELALQPGYSAPCDTIISKTRLKSSTDPDCGYIHHDQKKGLGYLAEISVDAESGIITGVDCYPANIRESDIILQHIKRQRENTGIEINNLGLDAGYDVGAVHRGCELLGIKSYCSPRELHNNAMRKGFSYLPKEDAFICQKGKKLNFYRLTYKKCSQNYYRTYRLARRECKGCQHLNHCAFDKGAVRINASGFYPAYYANRQRCQTLSYKLIKRLRSIWAEGSFAALKNQHNLNKIRKRGILRAAEECILAVLALNLKRLAKICGNLIENDAI